MIENQDFKDESESKEGLELTVPSLTAWASLIPTILSKANGRHVWCLTGDLGAGKTTFVQALMRSMGSSDDVSSPTFSLVNEYTATWQDRDILVYHLDLYRLEHIEELLGIGFEEMMHDGDLILIEWPQLAAPLLPADIFTLTFATDGNQRKIVVL